MEGFCLYCLRKTVNVRNLHDSGGGYVHQSNDTLRELSQFQNVKIRVIDNNYILSVSIATVGTLGY